MSIGILAYGSLIDDPGDEIAKATVRKVADDVMTPFPVEFARSSTSRKGAPTLVPVSAGGKQVKAHILVLSDTVSQFDAENMLWRRETRNTTGTYIRPRKSKTSWVSIDELRDFRGVDRVLYTSIGANISPLDASKLAELAIASAQAIKDGQLEWGRDGITYLRDAIKNGIATELSAAYEAEILRAAVAKSLDEAIALFTK